MIKALASTSLILVVLLLIWGAASPPGAGSQSGNVDYDKDDDGLIEISYLEQLVALRHDLDGEGLDLPNHRFPGAEPGYGCPIVGARQENVRKCRGYELTRPLDFQDPASYASNSVNPEWTELTEGYGWHPIGLVSGVRRLYSNERMAAYGYKATFDGNGHTISNLFIKYDRYSRSQIRPSGLFGVTSETSEIKRIGLDNVNVTSTSHVGGLVGINSGRITESYVTGRVLSEIKLQGYQSGGLVGVNHGRISDSHAIVAVSGAGGIGGLAGGNVRNAVIINSYADSSVSGSFMLGGLAGYNSGEVIYSYAAGAVTARERDPGGSHIKGVGGLVGINRGAIRDSYVTGLVSGIEAAPVSQGNNPIIVASGGTVGGLVGVNEGAIANSYSVAGVDGGTSGGLAGDNSGGIDRSNSNSSVSGQLAGGLVGSNHGRVTRSYAAGGVLGSRYVGGLVGDNDGSIIGSYAVGSVSGENTVGGLVGSNHSRIIGSYASGNMSGIEYVGALAGNNQGNISNSFWDTQTSCITAGVGIGASTGVEGKTTEQLQSSTGYNGIYSEWNIDFQIPNEDSDAPWDFGAADQYPVLKADMDGDGNATWQEFGSQSRSRPAGNLCNPPSNPPSNPPTGDSGGSCIPFMSVPPSTAAVNLLLMMAPLAMIGVWKRRVASVNRRERKGRRVLNTCH